MPFDRLCGALVLATAMAFHGASTGLASNAKANQLFGAKALPSAQKTAVVGKHAKGCIGGAVELPETGPTWQAMRLARNRNWAHPDMIEFVKYLGAEAKRHGWEGIYVGDLAQPRGGPMKSGHTSHQTGLDGDFWMLPPDRLNLTRREREDISSISVRTADQRNINGNWTSAHMNVLKAAASYPQVDRVFVAAAVKIDMCEAAGDDRAWLQKIRPLTGHNYHFHVRLKCPDDSPDCVNQTPTVSELSKGGDGCDETLTWWVTDYLEQRATQPKRDTYGVQDYVMADLPADCQAVLDAEDGN